MKYRYPFKAMLMPALLLTLCLSVTLVSMVLWLISAEEDVSGGSTIETVIPAVLTLFAWVFAARLAGKLRLSVFLWFSGAFWALQTVLIVLANTPLFELNPVLFSTLTMPIWSYAALPGLLAVQNQVWSAVLITAPAAALTTVNAWQIYRLKKPKKRTK